MPSFILHLLIIYKGGPLLFDLDGLDTLDTLDTLFSKLFHFPFPGTLLKKAYPMYPMYPTYPPYQYYNILITIFNIILINDNITIILYIIIFFLFK